MKSPMVAATAAAMAAKTSAAPTIKSNSPSRPRNITSRCTILSVVCFSLLIIIPILAHLQTASAGQLTSISSRQEQAAAASSLASDPSALNHESTGPRTARQASNGAGDQRQATRAAAAEDDDTDTTTLIVDFDQRAASAKPQPPEPLTQATGSSAPTPAAAAGAKSSESTVSAPIGGQQVDRAQQATSSESTVSAPIGGQQVDRTQQATSSESGRLIRDQTAAAIDDASLVEGMRAERATQAAAYTSPAMSPSMAKAKAAVDKVVADMNPEFNATKAYMALFERKPYSEYWSVEKKWEDVFERFMGLQEAFKDMIVSKFQKDAEKYADIEISSKCVEDLNYVRNITSKGTNVKWLFHMFDSAGKGTAGMLTGNMADLGHVVQCVRVRAPARGSMQVFDERFFEEQTRVLGERFRGKYCLVSVRPVLPEKPRLVSRFSKLMDPNLISNLSFVGESAAILKRRLHSMSLPEYYNKHIDRNHIRLDQIPFESELYESLKQSRNFMYSLPRYMGVCYPSSCTKEDIKFSIQKTVDDKHLVADIEFDCEQEENPETSEWYTAQRVIAYTLFWTIVVTAFTASVARNILVDKLALKRRAKPGSAIANVIGVLDMMSMDKCAGILFVKTHIASPIVDPSKLENNRSTAIDALKGALLLVLIYSQIVHQGCLGLTFMWSRWGDAMFPFFRAYITQIFLNVSIWAEAFYIISAYIIGLKFLENSRPSVDQKRQRPLPDFFVYTLKRYLRLMVPMLAFMLMNYIWPRLSHGFVMQDRANKIMAPCDEYGWTNFLMFHNFNPVNETCLWPSHVSASFFQLHLLSYPILTILLFSLRTQVSAFGTRKLIHLLLTAAGLGIAGLLAFFGLIYPALMAERNELIVPFLVDYLDYDNYQRVIEWTVLPTYNHLTSYMAGLVLAYIVVKKRLDKEINRANNDWSTHTAGAFGSNREDSVESVVSSSTQELSYKPAFTTVKHLNLRSACRLSDLASSESSSRGQHASLVRWASQALVSLAVCLVILACLTVSWLWTGLGNPMSFSQNFWFIFGTKLVFTISFAYLFYTHFALRRNSSNPWLITRFLVPIGRMSLMAFYVSWLVIWFDLLSSLYQWHPSHYFVAEKFNEIIFMTLVISMFAYGAFEGLSKKLQYLGRASELKRFPVKVNPAHPEETQDFDYLFLPIEADNEDAADQAAGNLANSYNSRQAQAAATTTVAMVMPVDQVAADNKGFNNRMLSKSSQQSGGCIGNPLSTVISGDSAVGRNLSIVDQYKLNAELRANNSFASVGLFETASSVSNLPPDEPPVLSGSGGANK